MKKNKQGDKKKKAGKYINLVYSTEIQTGLIYFQSIPREDNGNVSKFNVLLLFL